MSNDDRQRDMPLPEDRFPERSKTLDYPEAVLLVDPLERKFKGQVKKLSRISPYACN